MNENLISYVLLDGSHLFCPNTLQRHSWTLSKRLTPRSKDDGQYCVSASQLAVTRSLYRAKDKKVGEGTYAVVYQGEGFHVSLVDITQVLKLSS